MTQAMHHPGGHHASPHPRTAREVPDEHDRPAGRTRRRQTDDRAGARRVRRRIQLERRHRAVAPAGLHRHRPGQPAARRGRRFGLHRQPAQPDRRPGAAGRALLRRRGHLQRRSQRAERRRPGLRRRLRPRRRRTPRRSRERVQGQHPEHGPSPVQLSHRTRRGDRGRVRDQPGAAPGGLCRRSAAGDHGADGRDPASRRGRGVQRRLRTASLEEATVLGRGRHRRQGRGKRHRPVHGPAGWRRTSSRSRART